MKPLPRNRSFDQTNADKDGSGDDQSGESTDGDQSPRITEGDTGYDMVDLCSVSLPSYSIGKGDSNNSTELVRSPRLNLSFADLPFRKNKGTHEKDKRLERMTLSR